MKLKKRIAALLMAGAMVCSALPVNALAVENSDQNVGAYANTTQNTTPSNAVMPLADYDGPAIMLGANSIPGYNNGYHFVYYGERNSSPIKWRVLDDQTNTGASGLFLLSDALLGTGQFGGVSFDNGENASNAWQNSNAQTWCKTFYNDNFSKGEQGSVLATTKSDETVTVTSGTKKYHLPPLKIS